MKIKRLATLSLLSAIALGIFIAESRIPPVVPVPGVKLGLANIVTLFTISVFGRRDAALVLTVRIFLGSAFAASFSAFIYSAAGGVMAFCVMALALGTFSGKRLWILSVLAAIAHNLGQLAAAVLISSTAAILVWAPALLASGIATGVFTGLCAIYLLKSLKRL